MHKPWRAGLSRAARIMPMTHLQVDPPSYLKTPPLGGTLPPPPPPSTRTCRTLSHFTSEMPLFLGSKRGLTPASSHVREAFPRTRTPTTPHPMNNQG